MLSKIRQRKINNHIISLQCGILKDKYAHRTHWWLLRWGEGRGKGQEVCEMGERVKRSKLPVMSKWVMGM